MQELPLFFALRRHRPNIELLHSNLESYKNTAVLIQTTKNSDKTWSFTLMEEPSAILNGAKMSPCSHDHWLNNDIVEFRIKVKSSTVKTHITVVKFNNYTIDSDGCIIPLFKISDPCEILGDTFTNITLPQNSFYRFNLVYPKEITSTIPPHIVNIYIQSLLDKKDACPITMEPFEKTTTCITSCGHALSKTGAYKWISEKKSCPVCRTPCDVNNLATWT